MFKKIRTYVRSLKLRIICEMNSVNKAVMIFSTIVIFLAGIIITLHGICDMTCSNLVFPRGMPPVFFLVMGRFAIHFALGLSLGMLLAFGDRSAHSCALRAAVLVSLLVLCEMIWISVFYSFAIPFFSFVLTIVMFVLTLSVCRSITKIVFSVSVILYIYFGFLLLRGWFSLLMVLIN